MDHDIIKIGDYIIVQRQGYTKLHKLKQHGNLSLGKFTMIMDNVIGERYFDTFQMKNIIGNKKFYALEKVDQISTASNLNIESSGVDNRNIKDDGQSQKLSKEEIDELIDKKLSSNNIVESLINNSTTFSSKTEYSQEKYIKKKEKKYFEYIQIKRPTIRILIQMYYRQDPTKTLGLRIDDLSQILVYANVQSEGDYLLYDSGTSGLLPAAIMNAVGSQTNGRLIHVHPGNEWQKTTFAAMHFPTEQADRCIHVNLYSVLRCYYQNKSSYDGNQEENLEKTEEPQSKGGHSQEGCVKDVESMEINEDILSPETRDRDKTEDGEPSQKRLKLDSSALIQDSEPRKKQAESDTSATDQKKPGWQFENEKACRILKNKTDALIIISKEHPVSIAKELISFLKGGRSIVVFNLLKEPLQDLYIYLKSRLDIINIQLYSNFMRNYQVLPDRTHPEVTMTTGGYVLTAFKLNA